jgi:hypothetical protein
VQYPIHVPCIGVKADHPRILAEEPGRAARLYVVALVADRCSVPDRFDPQEQSVTRPMRDHGTERAGTPAQDADQVIGRLPREIARQLPG